jgi:hypothetical protein
MKGLLAFLLCLAAGLWLASCNTVQRIKCTSNKQVTVTYHDVQKGTFTTVVVPYCDSISLLAPVQVVPDSVVIKKDSAVTYNLPGLPLRRYPDPGTPPKLYGIYCAR